jgi:hypothetical protein
MWGDAERIQPALHGLPNEEVAALLEHLERMATVNDWLEAQR